MVFGPLEGDSAGVIYADTSQTIEVDLWMRTAAGERIVGFHIPLSSKDVYVSNNSRQGGEYLELLDSWDESGFLTSNADPIHAGYTNQSFYGVESLAGIECDNSIQTDGQWWWIATYRMTTVSGPPIGVPLCDALIAGYEPIWLDMTFVDCDDGIIPSENVELHFACLEIQGPSCGYYVAGDFNSSGEFNVADIVDSFSNLKTGLPEAAFLCECPPDSGNEWAVAMDVNGSCSFNVADIVTGFSYLKTGSPEPVPCGICPPGEP